MLSRLIDGGLRMLDQERLVRASGFWDADWYAGRYPEAGGPELALTHFLKTGAKSGHDPGPGFSTSAYLSENPDVREAGSNALIHYLRFGRSEGRAVRDTHGRLSGGADHGLNDAALARVRRVFDGDFYRATNPDLGADLDFFEHFMGSGWRQRRDPAPWFSTERYLCAHEDVAASGTNPFSHYVLTGCREARAIAPSVRTPAGRGRGNGSPRLAAVTMVKNEADIIRTFAGHLLALFDEIVIVDHRSDDGTAEYLEALAASNRRVELLRLDEPSYIQSVTMTHVVRDCPQLRQADWIFLLDADEFLPFTDRKDFERALAPFGACPAISMRWQNLIPEEYWDGEVGIRDDTRFLVPPAPSPFRKVAFQPGRIALDRTVVAQGNHGLYEVLNGVDLTAFEADFPLLHLPVRSVDQILLKLNQGVLSYQKIGNRRDSAQGTHWYQMKEATEGTSLSPDHLNALADRYSEQKEGLVPASRCDLLARGYRSATFALARQDDGLDAALPDRNPGELLMRLFATDYSDAAVEDRPCAARLETRDGVLVRADTQAEYARLPETAVDVSGDRALPEALNALLRPSYADIEDLVPSDWSGHIPFMFALVGLVRPRRFVELGTLRGASFFGFTQAARRAGLNSQAVAVSSWAVEASRAHEFRNVFEDFQYIARKYGERASFLRAGADEALHRFDEGSIDLLHLDGFRSYEGVRQALESWRPKLSRRGLVLIHDINAHGNDFGVWRLWDELKPQCPTIEFRHAQGLGLACIGGDVPGPLCTLAQAFRDNRDLATLLQEHFERLGALSAELFSRRYDMAQSEMRAAADGAQAEELSWLRQELASARSEADELRIMVKGGLRHVAGA